MTAYAGAINLLGDIKALNTMFRGFSPEDQENLDAPVSETVTTYLPSGISRMIEEKRFSDNAQKYRTRATKLEGDLSKLRLVWR